MQLKGPEERHVEPLIELALLPPAGIKAAEFNTKTNHLQLIFKMHNLEPFFRLF